MRRITVIIAAEHDPLDLSPEALRTWDCDVWEELTDLQISIVSTWIEPTATTLEIAWYAPDGCSSSDDFVVTMWLRRLLETMAKEKRLFPGGYVTSIKFLQYNPYNQ